MRRITNSSELVASDAFPSFLSTSVHACSNATQFQTCGTVTAHVTCGPGESVSAYKRRVASRGMACIHTPSYSGFELKSIIYGEFRCDVDHNVSAE
jgi:hypothetical protein